MRELLTTRQAARALGVSEASLKRYCDRGLLPVIRTPGGHRRLPLNGVMQFVRRQRRQIVQPELLGLPAETTENAVSMPEAADRMQAALEQGWVAECRQLAVTSYLDGQRVADICDRVIAPAFHALGERWSHGDLEVYEERRAVEICIRLLTELRLLLPDPRPDAPDAVGATLMDDPYSLPTTMVELALREAGWNAQSFGVGHPAATICRAIENVRPRLFWLSVSTIASEAEFVADYRRIYEVAMTTGAAVLVGGRALTPALRGQIEYAAYCDNLAHAVAFAGAFYAPENRQQRSTPTH